MTGAAASLRRSRDLREGGSWSLWQSFKNGVIHAAVRIGVGACARLPRAIVAAFCALVARVAWAVWPACRRRVAARIALGLERPATGAEVRGAFRRAGSIAADMLVLYRSDERAARTLELDAASHEAFASALAEGRGVVFVTAHLGSWERMAAVLVERGFPVATVARESYDPRLTACVYERLRARRGVRSIYRGDPRAAFRIARELGRGRAVGFLVDLPGRVPSVDVRLFGAPSRFPVGPARIALARRAAVVVGTPERARIVVRRVETADLEAGPEGEARLVERLTAELDARIRADFEAWFGLFAL